jgi:hypothetical protein
MRLLLPALVVTGAFVAPGAIAATPFQETFPVTDCNGARSCKLVFSTVPAGTSLTISHVSCGIVTSGLSAFVSSIVLSRVKSTRPGDYLPVATNVAGSNAMNVANEQTLFYVDAGDKATITISGGAPIIGSAETGCLISGTTTP